VPRWRIVDHSADEYRTRSTRDNQ